MLHGQPRDSAMRMSLCALGRYDILRSFLQYRARIDQHMCILELKGTSGLEEIPAGCTCAQAMPGYLQASQSPHWVLGLYRYPEFIHVLESCPRNVCNLACSILQLHCWKNPPASKSQPVPAQRLLSVAAGSAGPWPPVCRCLLTLCLHPSKGRICRLWDVAVCTPPASPAASFGLKERASRWITPHTPLLLRLTWEVVDLETWYPADKAERSQTTFLWWLFARRNCCSDCLSCSVHKKYRGKQQNVAWEETEENWAMWPP